MLFELIFRFVEGKVTLEGHINKLVRAITPTFMHGFQNKFAKVFSLRSSNAI